MLITLCFFVWLFFFGLCFRCVSYHVKLRNHTLCRVTLYKIGFISAWAALMGPVGVWLVHFILKEERKTNGR
jgi:hypothetical protein